MKLSICLVTFDDRDELTASLTALRSQQDALAEVMLKGEVELIISDNASTDDTQIVLADYEKGLAFPIRRYLQKRNLGFRGNLEFCATVANGQWVLYLGAGNVLNFLGVAKFLNRDWPEDCNLVYFNSQTQDALTGFLQVGNYEEGDKPAYSQAPFPIYRRLLLLDAISRNSNVSGDHWPQVEWAIAMSSSGPESISTLGEVLLSGNRPESGWWSRPSAFLVPLTMNLVLEESLRVERWNEARLREGLSSDPLMPAKWIYQSRVAHLSSRPSFRDVVRIGRFFSTSRIGGGATVAAITIWLLPRMVLRIIGLIVRRISPGSKAK
jgi:hypothetical protein